jgi:hypothetical protein
MKLKFIRIASVCILILSLGLCTKNITAETLDNDKEFILGAFDLPVQIIFDHHAPFSTWFIITFAFIFLPQQFLMQYIERHEKSPPCIHPVISF